MSAPVGDEPTPDATALAALDADDWAWLLTHVRPALASLDGEQATGAVTRLRAASAARLAGGALRTELCDLLAAGDAAWRSVRARIDAADEVPDAVAALLDGRASGAAPDAPDPAATASTQQARRRADRDRRAARELRAQRDELTRQLDGATARIRSLQAHSDGLAAQLDAATAEAEDLRRQLVDADAVRDRAVERERRRQDGRVAALNDELVALRRAEEQRRSAERARERARAAAAEVTAEEVDAADAGSDRLVPGRPSRLPAGVEPDTRPAAEALLHPGRLVLVDGYNVTLQHRGDLDLDAQRRWLVGSLANLAAARRVRPVVVFDGDGAPGGGHAAVPRGVQVRFTTNGITADDDIVFEVEATDEPVVVVTDDRELIERVARCGADVLRTAALRWLLP